MPPRLEADGLPSVDFAIRSPNVEEDTDEEGPSHEEGRPEDSLREAGDAGLGSYIDEIQCTEMDGPTPNSPPEKSRGAPGSPSPLELDGEGPLGEAGPDRAPLHTMPSPVRARRSLSPQHEAHVDTGRPNSYGQESNTDLMEDDDTEESMDELASFFQEGNIHVPMRVPADDELLEEPSQQERDCHSSQDGINRCCQHGAPCEASYPSPDVPAGPGGVAGPAAGRYAHAAAAPVEAPSHAAEPPAPVATAVDSRDLRAGVPRIPAPTAHQAAAELPSTTLSSGRLSPLNVRAYPTPSRAPVFAVPARTGDGPVPAAPPQASGHGAPYVADVSSQGPAPASETSGARPRPSAPLPEVLGPDSTIHSSGAGAPAGIPSAGHGGMPPAGPQSAGPIPAEPEGIGHLRSEGQVFSGVPLHTGQRPPATFGNPMPGLPPPSWGFAGMPPASHGSINQGPYPYSTVPPAYGTGQRVPQFQDMSVLPGLHHRSLGFSGGAPPLSQGPIAPPMPPPVHGAGLAMPAVPPAAPVTAGQAPIALPTHGLFGSHPPASHPPASFPARPANAQMGAVPGDGIAGSEPPMHAMPREGLQTVGRMPDEPDAPAGQGRPISSASGVPPAAAAPAVAPAVAAPAPVAAVAPATEGIPPPEPAPRAAAPRMEASRTEAPVPEQTRPVPPGMAHATPVSATQGSTQTEGPLPHMPHEEQDLQSPDISQGQLLPDHGAGAPVGDLHDDLGADSPSMFESPLAPSGAPDLDNIDEASHQLETPPPTVQKMDQGQQTTPEKPRMPRRKRPQADAVRLPRDGQTKLVQVDMDEVRSCNQAEGRPKRKQMRVLKGWQNERVVYERVPGSACPTICKVMVAQPLEQDQKAVPLELKLGEDALDGVSPLKDKTSSPLPSNYSDYTWSLGQSEEEKASPLEEPMEEPMEQQHEPEQQPQGAKKPRRNKSTSRLRRVEMAAKAGSAAAAAAFEGATPPRVRPSHSANGFVRVPIAEGSTDACEIRVGLDNGNWMSCDINIPPRSFNTPEQLAENRSILIYVMQCQDGTFEANVDRDIVTLTTGSSMVIRPGQEYCLRNRSDQVVAQLKMTLINSSRS